MFPLPHWLTLFLGGLIVTLFFCVAEVSSEFQYGMEPSSTVVTFFVGLMMAAGGVFLVLFILIPKMSEHRTALVLFVLLGGVARLVLFGSTPIYEDDWYRYLWDGAVITAGVNPYEISPSEASLVDGFGNQAAASENIKVQKLRELGANQDYWPERINYPFVTTIYPPMAQAAFAFANKIAPFNLDAWRLVLLIADIAGLAIIFALLKQWDKSPFWALLYWWNPILIVTTFNAAHMDILLTPLLGVALLLVRQKKPNLSAVFLAAAAAVKFWPVILAPVLFRQWRRNYASLALISVVLCGALLIFFIPMTLAVDPKNSGLFAYANTWERNAFIFSALKRWFDGVVSDPDLFARVVTMVIPTSFIVWAAFRKNINIAELPKDMLIGILLLYLMSPTGYPWYAIWFFILMPLAPSFGAAIFVVTLPIYYLRFSLERLGQGQYFNEVLVPIEFAIPIVCLSCEFIRQKVVHP